jgi:hypothetical protein
MSIFFFLNKKVNYQDKIKIKKKIQKLILRIDSFCKEIETIVLYENRIKSQKRKKIFLKLKKSKQNKERNKTQNKPKQSARQNETK